MAVDVDVDDWERLHGACVTMWVRETRLEKGFKLGPVWYVCLVSKEEDDASFSSLVLSLCRGTRRERPCMVVRGCRLGRRVVLLFTHKTNVPNWPNLNPFSRPVSRTHMVTARLCCERVLSHSRHKTYIVYSSKGRACRFEGPHLSLSILFSLSFVLWEPPLFLHTFAKEYTLILFTLPMVAPLPVFCHVCCLFILFCLYVRHLSLWHEVR